MKRQKFFLNCCEWLYQSAVSAGILFVMYAFLQNALAETVFFSEADAVLKIIAGVTASALFLIEWSDKKDCRIEVGLASFAIFAAGGILFLKYTENHLVFLRFTCLAIICIGVSGAVYAVWRYSVLKGLLICMQAVLLVTLTIMKKTIPIWCAGVILTAVLLFLVELRKREGKETLGLLPLFALVMLLLCRIPEKENTMDWSWVRSIYLTMREQIEMLAADIENIFWKQSDYAFGGYGNGSNGKIGGSAGDTGSVRLHITGSGTKNPLYLTGRVYESYDGEKWKVIPNETLRNEGMNDSLLNALKQSIYAEKWKELTSFSEISVEYRFIRTKDLFHELNTTDLYGADPAYQKGLPWTMKHAKKKDFCYSIRFLEINEESSKIKALYRQQAWKEDAVWDDEKSLQEAEIYKTDVLLPDEVPRRVYELARVLTKDAENDYDRMALLADYLEGYTYTKTPPACPDGWELTDYFLFESKCGYCGHFAAALAVLGRCAGIPTRYVQGYMTPDTGISYSDVELMGTDAHAWTEFYIEHIGWVRMDATPGFGKTFEDRWEMMEITETEEAESPALQGGFSDEMPAGIYDVQEVPEEAPVVQTRPMKWYLHILLKIMAGLVMIAIPGAVILRIRSLLCRKRYAGAGDPEKVQIQMKRLLRLGKLRGVSWADTETLWAYQERAYAVLDTERYSLARACALYEKIRFGGKNISAAELQELEAYAENREREYLAGCGRIGRFMYRVLQVRDQ